MDSQRPIGLVTLPTFDLSAGLARATAESVGILVLSTRSVNEIEVEHFKKI